MHPSSYKKIDAIHHSDPFVRRTISESFISILPEDIDSATILCIGTDRSTGDALGPMTGTLLKEMNPLFLNIRGTLAEPVHALNLDVMLKEMNRDLKGTFVIAIDASLGQLQSIGQFQYGSGSIMPGTALKKQLPSVGDAFITGVVNISGMMEYSVLQSTRLSLVYNMAETLAETLFHLDLQLRKSHKTNPDRKLFFL